MDSQLSQADIMIVDKANKIYEKYSKGAIKSDKAIEEITKLQTITENELSDIDDLLKLYKRIQFSEENFEKATKLYEENNLVEAITYFKKVIKEDSHYNTAQSQLKKVVGEYRTTRVEEAEKHAENEEYDKAILVMLDTLEILSDDEQSKKQLQTYKSAKLSLEISDIMDTVDVYSKKKEYVNAIKVVKKAVTTYGEDVRLLDMMSSLVDNMYKEVDNYIKSKRYTVAVTILKSYVRIVPDDEKAAGLITKYASNVDRGTYLSNIKWLATEGKSYKINDVANYIDAEGNKYESVVELAGYKNLDKTGSIVFDATNYKTLTGMVGYVNGEQIAYYKEGKGVIRIYGDNKQIFKSEVLSEEGKTQEIDLDISKYKQVKIAWSSADTKNIKTYGIVLGDISVK
jgi:tetratricopeptide (TPR) repeat protein